MRFGCEYVPPAQGRRLVVTDLGTVLTYSCAPLYGWRSARNRVKKVLATTSAP
jgi:predicted site-specific integrase-resolvase